MAKKAKPTTYVVSDGDLVLHLTKDEGKWYCVTAPFHEGMVTQARSIEEAFEMARDAIEGLREARDKYEKALRVTLAG